MTLINELEIPPSTAFELNVVNGNVNSFVPTTDNMAGLQKYHSEVLFFFSRRTPAWWHNP